MKDEMLLLQQECDICNEELLIIKMRQHRRTKQKNSNIMYDMYQEDGRP